ncbi:LOW QUALITY PROTEIN: hypothetical protein RJ639_014911, partial [Escallonia herrerae]
MVVVIWSGVPLFVGLNVVVVVVGASDDHEMRSTIAQSIDWVRYTYLAVYEISLLSFMVRLSNAHEYVPELYPETILCIEVYHSQRAWQKTMALEELCFHLYDVNMILRLKKEFLVLGQQPWSELRDKMYCLTDQIMKKAGQHDPSGYSLIEDVFCNDLREPSAIDYSKPILDWLRESKKDALEKWECILSGEIPRKRKEVLGSGMEPKLPQFKAVKMHKTRFCDLSFRIGSGYLYCHQGACKDVIVIRDMRLIHPEDVQNRAAYPVCTFQLKMRLQKCCLQDLQSGKVDDKWAPENPCYFCDYCFYMLHYVDGVLLYNEIFAYDYHHE